MSKRRKYAARAQGRMFIIFLFFLSIITTLTLTFISNLKQINDIKVEEKNLKLEKQELLDKQAALEADIEKLSDVDYIARYAREKYFYSRPGEIILRIEDKKK